MEIIISETKQELGKKAAEKGASLIRDAIRIHGEAHIIVATGASQFEMLEELVRQDVDWSKVTAFHLDEYIGLPMNHPASFRKYLKERFVDKVHPKMFHYVNERKAEAVKNTVKGPVTPQVPASILQTHPGTWLYLDKASASLLP